MGWRGPMTERQWEAWQAWRRQRWDAPDRTDHYLMQLTAAVNGLTACMSGKEHPGVDADKLKLKFRWEEQPQPRRRVRRSGGQRPVEQITLVNVETGAEVTHKVPQRLTKEGVQQAEQMMRLFQLRQSGPAKGDRK